jgi:hypothetical protein
MKKSELKEIIKASFLAEAEDSKKGNKEEQKRMEGAIRDDRDHIKDLEKDIKDNEEKLAKLKKDFKDDVVKEMKKDDGFLDVDEAMRGGSTYEEDDTMREAEEVNVEDNEDINVDVEDDIDIDDVSKKSEIEVDSELAGEDADVAAILGLLTKAQANAKDLGDEKLMDQIGNTITYYTRTHVVAEEMKDDMDEAMRGAEKRDRSIDRGEVERDVKEELDESLSRFAKLAGLK